MIVVLKNDDFVCINDCFCISGPIVLDRSTSQMEAAAKAIADEKLPLILIHVGGIADPEDVTASRCDLLAICFSLIVFDPMFWTSWALVWPTFAH